jgi:hypothetical protein
VIINGLHVLAFVVVVFGVPIGIAFVGDLLQARRNPPSPRQRPPMDYERHHYGPAFQDHINRTGGPHV